MKPHAWQVIGLLLAIAHAGYAQAAGKMFPGADAKTPSRSEYFTWINNTGEGSTEAQTLTNLEFFQWLHDEYGMVLDIYAFDAGNIDKSVKFGPSAAAKFKTQFPRGYGPLADQAAAMGTRLGVWDGPDGFGNTPDDETRKIEQMVSLCRDYHFELFKFDGMGGDLRAEKQDAFVRMMTACRAYNPDLILLNHRLDLGKEGVKHATTWLLGGAETYIDVHMPNECTATHHRAGALAREVAPGLQRLTEDHGVCLSSCLDYWEDDLILQAFNRNLILAPQLYGNPWFLRDDEYPKLARIFNLTRQYKNLLVNGIVLPAEKYGANAVSRGDDQTRLVTLRNIRWQSITRTIQLDDEIGLVKGSLVELRQLHPVERIIGRFPVGATVEVEVLPFRSCLLLATSATPPGPAIEGCDFEIVREVAGKPVTIQLLAFPGEKKTIRLQGSSAAFTQATLDGQPVNELLTRKPLEIVFPGSPIKDSYHRKLGDLTARAVPADAEALYEATCFAADNNALEARSLVRSGPTLVPQVQQARGAFTGQYLFRARGLWDRYLFDGDDNTSFYVSRRFVRSDFRLNGGSLRLDLGEPLALDSLAIHVANEQSLQPFKTLGNIRAEVSADLITWRTVNITGGIDMTLPLDPTSPVRYVRLPGTPESINEITGFKDGVQVDRSRWRASILFSPYQPVEAKAAFECGFVLAEIPRGSYLAIALNGRHGIEGAYAALRVNGRPVGAPDRSVSFVSNTWEYPVPATDANYTYYIPLTPEMKGARIDAVVLVMKNGLAGFKPEVWITAYPIPYATKELLLY